MDKTQQGHVTVTRENGVSTIEFFHPSHNALPGNLLEQLSHHIHSEGIDNEVKVIVLKSAGDRTFCAGASFDELSSISNLDEGKNFFMGFANVINALRKCPKLVIGRVQGKAVGGGVGLASAVDYCLATKYASIKLSELAVGIGPFVVGPAVERKVGKSAFTHLSINASEWQSASWAREKGLYSEVMDNTDDLDHRLSEFSKQLSEMSFEAMKGLKKIFWEGTENWDSHLSERAAMSGALVLSEPAKKAIAKFLNA